MKTNITKKILLGAILFCGLFGTAKAQTAYDDQQYNDQQNNSQQNNNQQYSYSQPQQYAPQTVPADEQSFYYYPDANVYYDINYNRYIYYNGSAWLTVNTLPAGIFIGHSPRVMVYHNGPRVWMDNAIHFNAYRRPAFRASVAFNGGGFRGREDFRRVAYNGRGAVNFNRGGFARGGFNRGGGREAHYRR